VKVYFISGLGADRRIFKNIQLPPSFQPVFLDWIPPLKNESLSQYALRLAENIDRNEEFSLIGLSMGGMLAVEIARQLQPVQTILISSIPVSGQLPSYYRWLGALQLHKLLPVVVVKRTALVKRLFTAETREDKKMLDAMVRNMDVPFMRWALGAILQWKNSIVPEHLFQLHGTRDEILPVRLTKPTYRIKKGGHLMILNRAREINALLAQILVTNGKG
jgi:pimeloyl-ACP methyl ester carboxylesterase